MKIFSYHVVVPAVQLGMKGMVGSALTLGLVLVLNIKNFITTKYVTTSF